jgi:hypothetical protein
MWALPSSHVAPQTHDKPRLTLWILHQRYFNCVLPKPAGAPGRLALMDENANSAPTGTTKPPRPRWGLRLQFRQAQGVKIWAKVGPKPAELDLHTTNFTRYQHNKSGVGACKHVHIWMSIFGLVVVDKIHIIVYRLALAQSRFEHGWYARRNCLRRQWVTIFLSSLFAVLSHLIFRIYNDRTK